MDGSIRWCFSEPMWDWIRNYRQRKVLETPFPVEWESILETRVAHYRRLNEKEQKKLRDMIQLFVAEKYWEGCGGLVLTDEVRVVIAAGACLLILAIPNRLYRNVKSIFVYPSTVMTPDRKPGVFESSFTPARGSMPILGEAHLRGPIILVWDAVKHAAKHPETSHNVVYHEFAHKLDMLDGRADGTPQLTSTEQYRRWVEVCEREFLRLRSDAENGKSNFLDSYGATNEAEFFAVITEQFFELPEDMKNYHPDLYELLRDFYRQDPAEKK